MASRRNYRKKRKSYFGVVIAVLIALIVMCAIAAGIMHINKTKVARYPVLYTEEITAAAEANSVPAPFIAAIIMTESSYDPNAVSHADAYGLMQIIPSTGEWIAGKFSEEFDVQALLDHDVNIKYGAWYLGYLMDRFDGDLRCVAAAYFSGQNTVSGWLADPQCSSDGVTLENIPSSAANSYVNKVLKYYEYYTQEYEKLTAE